MRNSSGYTVTDYGTMILDDTRMRAFDEAIRRYVRAGSVVADLGAGTGIFSLLACKYGASRVYAIEPDASIAVARATAAKNGYGDRITCIEGLSTETTLPEKVDVVVSDMRGTLPLYEHHVAALADARARLLRPDGVLIPQRDRLRCAPVHAPDELAKLRGPWLLRPFDLDLSPGARHATSTWTQTHIAAEQLLGDAVDLASLEYGSRIDPNVDAHVELEIRRSGALHGFCIWFDAELAPGIGYSNAPGLPDLVYGRSFVPLASEVAVEAGDRVELELRANLIRGRYVYRWDTRVIGAEGEKASFRQSTASAHAISTAELRKRAEGFVPRVSERGLVDQEILLAMSRGATLGAIATSVHERHPTRFRTWRAAFDHVAELSSTYSE